MHKRASCEMHLGVERFISVNSMWWRFQRQTISAAIADSFFICLFFFVWFCKKSFTDNRNYLFCKHKYEIMVQILTTAPNLETDLDPRIRVNFDHFVKNLEVMTDLYLVPDEFHPPSSLDSWGWNCLHKSWFGKQPPVKSAAAKLSLLPPWYLDVSEHAKASAVVSVNLSYVKGGTFHCHQTRITRISALSATLCDDFWKDDQSEKIDQINSVSEKKSAVELGLFSKF